MFLTAQPRISEIKEFIQAKHIRDVQREKKKPSKG